MRSSNSAPLIVGIGGGANAISSTERALRVALAGAETAGAQTLLFGGAYLAALPIYLTPGCDSAAKDMIQAVRQADGLIIGSPGYHGSVSGLVKNALDYLEAMAGDPRPYLDGVPVGLIATASGWQATGGVLATLRTVVHALRGWPTPFGAALSVTPATFAGDTCADPQIAAQLCLVGRQVAEQAALKRRALPHVLDLA